MPTLDTLRKLLQEELKDLYDAEKQLIRALPKLAKKATAPELRQALEEHLSQTEQHVARIEQAFDQLDMPNRGKKCKGMQNLIAEGDEMIAEAEDGPARDAVMIAAARKVEHYEIASYGTVRTWATLLGNSKIAALLETTLDEEKDADTRLTSIAESQVNDEAAAEDELDERSSTTRSTNGHADRGRKTSKSTGGHRSASTRGSGSRAGARSARQR